MLGRINLIEAKPFIWEFLIRKKKGKRYKQFISPIKCRVDFVISHNYLKCTKERNLENKPQVRMNLSFQCLGRSGSTSAMRKSILNGLLLKTEPMLNFWKNKKKNFRVKKLEDQTNFSWKWPKSSRTEGTTRSAVLITRRW